MQLDDHEADALPPRDHNLPTDPIAALRAELEEDETTRKLRARRDELLAAAGRMPAKIDGEETAGKFADMARMLRACLVATKSAKAERKRPVLDQGTAIESFFRAISEPLEDAKREIDARQTFYLTEKRKAERAAAAKVAAPMPKTQARGDYGGVASLQDGWDFEIENIEAIPLDTLRRYLARAAIEQAIRAFIRDGGRVLKGVAIVEAPKARNR